MRMLLIIRLNLQGLLLEKKNLKYFVVDRGGADNVMELVFEKS